MRRLMQGYSDEELHRSPENARKRQLEWIEIAGTADLTRGKTGVQGWGGASHS